MSRTPEEWRHLNICGCLLANHIDGVSLTPEWWRANAPNFAPPTDQEIAKAVATITRTADALCQSRSPVKP